MNYQAFTNDSLTMMYEGIRGALNPTMNLLASANRPGFAFERHPIGKKHAADLEAEMISRGMTFDLIDWDDGQSELPFEE